MRNMEERRFNCAGINCAKGVEAVRIQTLIEDTSGSNTELVCEHGLSFYLETALHKVLFDLGVSGGFLKNARALRIDLTQVDTGILSHGHNDHGGGLREFLSVNNKAKVYVQESAFEGHYSVSRGTLHEIGLDPALHTHPQIVRVAGDMRIDEELFLFSSVSQRTFWPQTNANLMKQEGQGLVPDDFRHEQYLAVADGDKNILFSGCAHRGIVNIMERYCTLFHRAPDVAVTGMHLTSPRTGKCEDYAVLERIAQRLAAYPTQFVTGHCTGEEAYCALKQTLGVQIELLHTGDIVLGSEVGAMR